MTFTEEMDINMEYERNIENFGYSLKGVLHKAQEDDRLVIGVYECAKILQDKPEEVCLCLLPDISETEDVTTLIHHKLVEAFCWENDIALVKVDSFKKLGNMITTDQMNVNNINVGCVLIQNAKPDKSEEHLINLLVNQCPVIELPE